MSAVVDRVDVAAEMRQEADTLRLLVGASAQDDQGRVAFTPYYLRTIAGLLDQGAQVLISAHDEET